MNIIWKTLQLMVTKEITFPNTINVSMKLAKHEISSKVWPNLANYNRNSQLILFSKLQNFHKFAKKKKVGMVCSKLNVSIQPWSQITK
jgi:hypothetical protein